jgi:hypothetical protein
MKGKKSGSKREQLSLSTTEINVIESLSVHELEGTGRLGAF